MAYRLGPVKPHVQKAADYFGPKHGITNIGGYRSAGSVPNSDHPKGLALDFMTRDKGKGDALAADLLANRGAYNVTYVIWWRQINSGDGWRPYRGPSAHTDHVHASFGSKAGSGAVVGVGTTPVGLGDTLGDIWGVLTKIDDAFRWLAENWDRILMFIAGLILALIAAARWSNAQKVITAVGKGVKNAKP